MEKTENKAKALRIVRAFFGSLLILVTVSLTALVTADMLYRINNSAAADTCKRMFIYIEAICAVLVLLSVDVRTGFLTKIKFVPVKILGIIIRTVLILLTVIVAVMGVWIGLTGSINNAADAETVIVLGMALDKGMPNSDLAQRVGAASDYAKEHPQCIIIVSGGNAAEGRRSEAERMAALLEQDGIEKERIITEDKSADTRENFANCAKLADTDSPTVIVTSSYHMARAVGLAREAGFKSVTRLPSSCDPANYCTNMLWEIVASANSMIFGK